MFVISTNRFATKQVAEGLLPQGRSSGIARSQLQELIETRSDAIARGSCSDAVLVASISETESCKTPPSVPRICYKAPEPLTSGLETTNTPLNRIANSMAQQILPTQRATRNSDRTLNARTNLGTERKASNYHGKTITKQCLPPPSWQSFRRRKSQSKPLWRQP